MENTNPIRIPLARPQLSDAARRNVQKCFDDNWLSQGPFNKEFEAAFAKRVGAAHASSCANGTAALWLAMKALGIGVGDEVIVPTLTFSATVSSVVATGATPVFCESREADGSIDPSAVAALVTSRTKAIIPVDLYGIAAPYRELVAVAKAHNLFVIEDSAESLGGTYDGKPLGTQGDIGCFSFFPNKVMTTGEGGMCVTNSEELVEKMNLYKNHGSNPSKRYWPLVSGFNMRMTNMQAAVGVAQLAEIESFLAARYDIFEEYLRLLATVSNIVPLPFKDRTYGPWLFTVRIPGKAKEDIVARLREQGIESAPGFYPLHQAPAFAPYASGHESAFPIATTIAGELVNLPTFVGLTKEQIGEVVDALKTAAA